MTSDRRTQMLVQPAWLAEHLGDRAIRVLDCTTYMRPQPVGPSKIESGLQDYEQAHIPGAQHVDMVTDLSNPDGEFPYTLPKSAQIDMLLSGLGIGNDHQIVLYARSTPVTVTRAWYVLRAFGHQRVSVLEGGFQRWESEGFPVTNEEPSFPATAYHSRLDQSRLAEREEVLAAIEDKSTSLVNSLGRDQFAGTGGAHYGRPGRIPGSINVPATELVDPITHAYASTATMRKKFDDAGLSASQRAITYCGGGIAASAGAFALELIGHDNWALYDNSLLEWSTNPELPMQIDS